MEIKELTAYRVVNGKRIPEIGSEGIILEHKKTGARIFLLENDDPNKVFCIGFRTPPADSTGVAHITEHSVLCGSKKFPVKDPFVELVKGSLNTFLNAMTYPDKTVYPVASCNDRDFQNLMDVYMDAVFNPNIYREEKIFRQEGWHYEMEAENSPLTINGVVYNEMKGAFSSPESVLERYTQNILYPDTCYAFESGGDPADIPDLTYEEFLDFHRKYYHPSNSFIYLYGKMDMAEKLLWLDREYLSGYDRIEVDSEIRQAVPFRKPAEKEIHYSITGDQPEDHATYLSLSTVVGGELDPVLYTAFTVLEYVLLDASGAALKKALIEAGIGEDILGSYDNGIREPSFSIVAKNAEPEQKEDFLRIIRETLTRLADEGINKKSLLAGINFFEFRSREADFGSYPKGLMYGLQSFDSWLYGGDPMMHLFYEETYRFLREKAGTGYFEELIRKYLLDNPWQAVIVVRPEKNLTEKEEAGLRKKLKNKKASLSPEEIRDIIRKTAELKRYQEEPSPKEDLEKIPLLAREDISPEPEKGLLEVRSIAGCRLLAHEIFTSGIAYLRFLFNLDRVPAGDLPYAALLKTVLGDIDTEKYSYGDLSDELDLTTGGWTASLVDYADFSDPEKFTGLFDVSVRVFPERMEEALRLTEEILFRSRLDDSRRIREIIDESRSRAQMRLTTAAHTAAVKRACSYFAADKAFEELTSGISWYRFLEDLAKNFEEKKEEISVKLRETAERLFTAGNLTVSLTGDRDAFATLSALFPAFKGAFPERQEETYPFTWTRELKNEGFLTPAQVCYVARCGTFAGTGIPYTAALKTLKVILGYDYLWINVRVKGGAYGVMNGTGRSGTGYFVSYRDPNLAATNEIFEQVADYLETFDADERDMTKYVIGTMSDLDAPILPPYQGTRGDSAYYSGVTDEMLLKERREILSVTPADIRALAPIIRAVLDTGAICVVGNAEKVKKDAGLFHHVENLFR